MRTADKVIDEIYKLIDIDAVRGKIDGEIYKIKRAVNADKFDIVINSLPIVNLDTQSITVFINAYKENFEKTGTPDVDSFVALAEVIITAIEAYTGISGMFLSIKIIEQNILNDNERKNTSYLSIRLQCYIENDSEE